MNTSFHNTYCIPDSSIKPSADYQRGMFPGPLMHGRRPLQMLAEGMGDAPRAPLPSVSAGTWGIESDGCALMPGKLLLLCSSRSLKQGLKKGLHPKLNRTPQQTGQGGTRVMKQGTAICLITALSVALAGEAGAVDDQWHIEISPYFWGVSIDGDVSVDNIPYDNTYSDYTNVRDDFQASAAGFITVRKGHWLLMADGSYLKIDDQRTEIPLARTTTGLKSTLATLAAGYRFTEGENEPSADVFVGGRYNRYDVDVDMPPLEPVSKTQDWIDPIAGVTLSIPVNSWLWFIAMVDFGGFSAGSRSAREFMPVFRIDLSSMISLKAGYRWMDVEYDYEDDDFCLDTVTQGWLAGISFRF
jgi:hypothetical protein